MTWFRYLCRMDNLHISHQELFDFAVWCFRGKNICLKFRGEEKSEYSNAVCVCFNVMYWCRFNFIQIIMAISKTVSTLYARQVMAMSYIIKNWYCISVLYLHCPYSHGLQFANVSTVGVMSKPFRNCWQLQYKTTPYKWTVRMESCSMLW